MKDALRALLSGSIDYAGLFPPATLPLEAALENYAAYIRSPDAWMLGAFVLPVAKFDAASIGLGAFDVDNRMRVGALGAPTANPTEFLGALSDAANAIRAFNFQHGAIANVVQLEVPVASQPGVKIDDAFEALDGVGVPVFLEAPPDDAERMIAALAEKRDGGAGIFGYKLRTGGVVASAFPSSIQIARVLVAAIAHRVPIKFTAGLHHPVRQFHSSVQTKMHGFLNVFAAAVLAAEHGWDFVQTAALLEDEDAESFTIAEDQLAWREWGLSADRIRAHRALVTSYGSCSFDEPREDLRALRLL